MEQLLNITGRGEEGFPVSTEVLNVLHERAWYIEPFLGSLGLAGTDALATGVLLYYERYISAAKGYHGIKNAIVYYSIHPLLAEAFGAVNSAGFIVRLENDETANLNKLLTEASLVEIKTTKQDIIMNLNGQNGQGAGERVWREAYENTSIKLTTSANPNAVSVQFCLMKDILKTNIYKNLRVEGGINLQPPPSNMIIRKNEYRIQMRFDITLPANASDATLFVDELGCPDRYSFPVYHGNQSGVNPAYVVIEKMNYFSDFKEPYQIFIRNVHAPIYINHEIILK